MFAALLLVSCTAGSDRETTPNPDTSGSATTSAADCPVTLPNGHRPPGDQNGLPSRLSHGSGGLWVELYPRGIVRPAYYGRAWPNGTIAVKFPWTRGVPGHLKITGRRLDADAPDLQSSVPTWLRQNRVSIFGGPLSDARVLGGDGPCWQRVTDVCHGSAWAALQLSDWTQPHPPAGPLGEPTDLPLSGVAQGRGDHR